MPLNFNSPYKARSAVDFWHRWHMSLSRFLRDYLYISLGGNRKARARRYVNLWITMLLGGLWHGRGGRLSCGAECTGLSRREPRVGCNARQAALGQHAPHARGLLRHHLSRRVRGMGRLQGVDPARRGNDVQVDAGTQRISLPGKLQRLPRSALALAPFARGAPGRLGIRGTGIAWIVALLAIAWIMPNVQQVMHPAGPSFEECKPAHRPGDADVEAQRVVGDRCGRGDDRSLVAMSGHVSEFLYFQF